MAKTFHPKIENFFSLRNTLKRIFMLFPEFTKNQNPTKSDQIRPNPTKSVQIRPKPTKSDRIRPKPTASDQNRPNPLRPNNTDKH